MRVSVKYRELNDSKWREKEDVGRKTLAEKLTLEHHRNLKILCCVFPTSNAVSTFIKRNISNFHSNKGKVAGMSILAFCLVSRVLFYSSPEDRVGN